MAAAGYHHNPTEAPSEVQKIVYIVHAADKIASMLEGGFRLDNPSTEIHQEVVEFFGITEEMVQDTLVKLNEALEEPEEHM